MIAPESDRPVQFLLELLGLADIGVVVEASGDIVQLGPCLDLPVRRQDDVDGELSHLGLRVRIDDPEEPLVRLLEHVSNFSVRLPAGLSKESNRKV